MKLSMPRLPNLKNPEWVPDKKLNYPSAGILMNFWRSKQRLDLSQSDGLIIEYPLERTVSTLLVQEIMRPGEEMGYVLPQQLRPLVPSLVPFLYCINDFFEIEWFFECFPSSKL